MYKIYQVEFGDNLAVVSNKTGTSIEELKKINGIMGMDDLMVGSLIVIPSKDNNFFTYKVKRGDSIYSIANSYGVNYEDLLLLNGLDKDEYIYPEQEIIIPSKTSNIYITKKGDTISKVINNLDIDYDEFFNDNKDLILVEDQLIAKK